MKDSDAYRSELEATKRASVSQLLFKTARLLNERALATARERSGQELRPAHTSLLPHVDLDGTPQSVLVERLGVSKQAVSQLVGEMEAMGVLERVPDPADRRAKLVRFSERGRSGLLEGLALLGEIEAELAERIGDARMRALHEGLLALLDVLEAG